MVAYSTLKTSSSLKKKKSNHIILTYTHNVRAKIISNSCFNNNSCFFFYHDNAIDIKAGLLIIQHTFVVKIIFIIVVPPTDRNLYVFEI